MTYGCPGCGADDTKIHDKECDSCDGSGECGFCQGEEQEDCPYDCNNSVCSVCDGDGVESGYVQCDVCGESGSEHDFHNENDGGAE